MAKSLLEACIIQSKYDYSDEETALQIQEGPYLQFFCGFPQYEYKRPFDSSLMVYFRKRLTPDILGEINELIIKRAKEESAKNHHDGNDKRESSQQKAAKKAGNHPNFV
nr:transposase [uncultured Caproiciproducens sp.]